MNRFLTLVLLILSCSFVSAEVTVIKAGRLIDPDEGKVLTDQVIVIRDNKIESVGKGITAPREAKVIDLSNMTVPRG